MTSASSSTAGWAANVLLPAKASPHMRTRVKHRTLPRRSASTEGDGHCADAEGVRQGIPNRTRDG